MHLSLREFFWLAVFLFAASQLWQYPHDYQRMAVVGAAYIVAVLATHDALFGHGGLVERASALLRRVRERKRHVRKG